MFIAFEKNASENAPKHSNDRILTDLQPWQLYMGFVAPSYQIGRLNFKKVNPI
jgi:hypothetical protein